MTLDEISEFHDDMGLSGDTPMRIRYEGTDLQLDALVWDPNTGVVTIELGE